MRLSHILVAAALLLTGCARDPLGVRIENGPAPADLGASSSLGGNGPALAQKPANDPPPPGGEPVFYNGKTYGVQVLPGQDGAKNIVINGMSAEQAKDASAVSVSSLRQFACTGAQQARLLSQPQFTGSQWKSSGRCL